MIKCQRKSKMGGNNEKTCQLGFGIAMEFSGGRWAGGWWVGRQRRVAGQCPAQPRLLSLLRACVSFFGRGAHRGWVRIRISALMDWLLSEIITS